MPKRKMSPVERDRKKQRARHEKEKADRAAFAKANPGKIQTKKGLKSVPVIEQGRFTGLVIDDFISANKPKPKPKRKKK